jgi:hypothetical protein
MKITKRQLRQIIKEEKAKVMSERSTGNPALRSEEQALRIAVVNFADKYMMSMGMNAGDARDLKKVRTSIDDMVNAVMGVM